MHKIKCLDCRIIIKSTYVILIYYIVAICGIIYETSETTPNPYIIPQIA